MQVQVLPRVHERHPDITEQQVRHAWSHIIKSRRRNMVFDPTQYMAIGTDQQGRALEMLAFIDAQRQEWVIYHAMPASRKAMRELNMT